MHMLSAWQVETFGSMEKKEKVEFILEQMRLCLAKKDYVRTQIISKKINTKYFEDVETHVSNCLFALLYTFSFLLHIYFRSSFSFFSFICQ